MAKFDTNTLLFNIGGLALVLVAGTYVVSDAWNGDVPQTCRDLYPAPTAFAVRNTDGRMLSPIELQARAGRKEWGIIENVRVVENKSETNPALLEVKLASAKANAQRVPGARGGIGMNWAPIELAGGARRACLGYNVFLPKDFDFGAAGILPGLYGGNDFDGHSAGNGKTAFSARLMWRTDGAAYVNAQLPQAKGPQGMILDGRKVSLPRGRWVSVQQEVILNAPGKSNGGLRLWIDGQLVIEKGGLVWRQDDKVDIGGVVGSIDYGSVEKHFIGPQEATLRLTPFTLSWQ